MRRRFLTGLAAASLLAACDDGIMAELRRRDENKKKSHAQIATASKAFIEKNRTAEGVQVTASGLQYKIVRRGEGNFPKPKATERVLVNYEGKLVDGTVFDSSYERGQPADFRLDQVIPAWTEGMQLMAPGDEFVFYVPSELGYGAEPQGDSIPPNAALIFRVELLAFQRADGSIVPPPPPR